MGEDHGSISKHEQNVALSILERGLKTAIKSCPPSLSANLSQQLALACEGIVFWMWKFVGEDCDENYKNWKFEGPNGQDGPRTLALYNCADIIVHLLQFDTVEETLGRSRLLHQMLLDWWTATSNGEIIVDPWSGLGNGLQDGVPDLQVLIFACLSRHYAKEMAEAIMSPPPHPGGRTPATFTTGTIQRMRSLTRINTQRHQGHWPAESVTYEIANLNGIVLGLYTCEIWDRVDTCPSPLLLYLRALGVEGGFNFGDTTALYEM
ncbi:hypothetical protein FA13DRAFT_1815764 [Coprinellus micaceus]|uniref:Uncharacterized protein n=1 Tax=Coprinellus micaceus TaxID=71717 RepID=A0A4Y7T3W1_COPMI|nr:hypothetical protein FA13DRAFT_1815764 [Coprinellus micaceus]